MTAVDPTAWDAFVEASDPGSYLQLTAWAAVKAVNGWAATALERRRAGRADRRADPRPPASADAVGLRLRPARAGRRRLDARRRSGPSPRPCGTGCRPPPGRISHVRIDPEIEADGPLDPDGALRRALRAAGWRPAPPIQPNATRIIDLRADEEALWGDLRKKWRQYVNKARTGGDHGRRCGWRPARRVLPDLPRDRGPGRLPDPRRVGLPRRLGGVRARAARARLLFAQTADGEPQATLFLVRGGPRVVEPYGGMTAAGGESRANYLLKWEAIRSSREAGATSYDLWGLATGGIAHFKTGFGGREVRYIGAWDLVLEPARPAGLRTRPARPRPAGRAGAAGSATGGSAAAYGAAD